MDTDGRRETDCAECRRPRRSDRDLRGRAPFRYAASAWRGGPERVWPADRTWRRPEGGVLHCAANAPAVVAVRRMRGDGAPRPRVARSECGVTRNASAPTRSDPRSQAILIFAADVDDVKAGP